MKKAIISAMSVFLALMVICAVFIESISAFIAGLMFKEKVSVYNPSDKTENVVLKKNDYIYLGKFNGENILWKVISVDENGNPLLLSERAVCFMPFNAGKTVTAGSSDWKNSTIRNWLNSCEIKSFEFDCNPENKIKGNKIIVKGGFLCTDNFTASELSVLKSFNDDKVFLPTAKMISGIDLKSRSKSPTVSAVINDPSAYLHIRSKCWYWTQSPISTNTSSVTAVTTSGEFYKSLANDGLTGVCPAVYLNGVNISVCGGNGTVKTPYIFASEGIINE